MPNRACLPLRACLSLVLLLHLTAGQFRTAAAEAAGNLTVRVLDAETGGVIPARLVLQTSDGLYPGDRLDCSAERWPNIEAHGIYIDGEERFEIPAGTTRVTAAHGLAYHAESATVEVAPGQPVSIELRLKSAVDMRKAGWVSGDLHVHMIHGEMQRETSYADVALTCAASGLDFVSVGQEYSGAGELDLAGYQAACRQVSNDDFQMFLGAERPKNLLGHQTILGVDNPFLIAEDPPYFQAAHAVHARGGVLVYVHPLRYYPGKQWGGQWLDFPGNNLARELVFDSLAGPSFDGLSVLSDEPALEGAHQLWFNLLNRGCFVPVFADSDACFDRPTFGLKAPGLWNTYFYLGPDAAVTPQALAEAVRRGRTMATTGPLVRFRIDGQESGATLPPDGQPRQVTIEADYPQHSFSLRKTDPQTGDRVVIARIELIRNGQVVEQWEPGSNQASITHTITEEQPSWYAVRAVGSDERWQVALASPIYFAPRTVPPKRDPMEVVVRGRIYDFSSGAARSAEVEIRRQETLVKRFRADGQFRVKMPIDAEIVVHAEGQRRLRKNLLMDHGPVHRFLWNLESQDLGRDETFDRLERLVREVDWEFPIGYRMPGSFVVRPLSAASPIDQVRVLGGPDRVDTGTAAVAAVLFDAERIAPGDSVSAAVIFRDEGRAGEVGPYVIEARGYDPSRPSGFGPLKKFASLEATWDSAVDLGDGYKLVSGSLALPSWVDPGPTGAIDVSVRIRQGSSDAAFLGFAIPVGPTQRALSLSSGWPTIPLSWPDRHYGIGPFKICNRLGRQGMPKADYRDLHLELRVGGESLDLLPSRDAMGTADADDALYTEHFFDQVLAEQTGLADPARFRPQPPVEWEDNLPLIDGTQP